MRYNERCDEHLGELQVDERLPCAQAEEVLHSLRFGWHLQNVTSVYSYSMVVPYYGIPTDSEVCLYDRDFSLRNDAQER